MPIRPVRKKALERQVFRERKTVCIEVRRGNLQPAGRAIPATRIVLHLQFSRWLQGFALKNRLCEKEDVPETTLAHRPLKELWRKEARPGTGRRTSVLFHNMRAIWKGSISFGLINIPIALFPATQREELRFRLLRASDLSPVNYKRVAETDGKEVPWDQIVKGYEYEKDKFIVLKEDDFKRVDVEATQTVEIMDFVSLEDINPIHFQKPYYMEPQKGGQRAYVLLRDALASSGKVGIAKVVIKTRQHLAAVKPNDGSLMLELMHFADELIEPSELHLPGKTEVRKGELDMARELIGKMTTQWDPKHYTDEYKSALMKVIEAKAEKGEEHLPRAKKPRRATNVIDLADVLRKSLSQAVTAQGKQRRRNTQPKHRKAA